MRWNVELGPEIAVIARDRAVIARNRKSGSVRKGVGEFTNTASAQGRSGYCSLELAAGGVDIASARTTDEGRNAGGNEELLKGMHAFFIGGGKGDAGPGIEGNQVYFAANAAQQFDHLAGVLRLVIHVAQQHIFKGDALTVAEREVTRRLREHFQVPFPVQRHYLITQLVIGSIQGDRQLGPHWFRAKVMDSRNDPGG